MNYLSNLFQQIQQTIPIYCPTVLSTKVGRTPKVSDVQLCALYILSYITNIPVLNLAKTLIDSSIQSWHLFRKERTKRIYKLLREYMQNRAMSIIFLKLLLGEKVRLIVDGTILEVAKLSRARTQKIKRFSGKAFWGKKKRKLYSHHYKREVEFEELYYGVLVMVLCDENGVVYDIWFHPASYNEVKSFRLRKSKSKWFRFLVETFEVIGDKGYRGCEHVVVCERKESKSIRQAVEGVNSQIKVFNYISRWRKGITLLAYLYGYAIGYSGFRKSYVLG